MYRMTQLKTAFNNTKTLLLGLVLVTAFVGAVSVAHPSTAHAAACDAVNIVYCGLDGRGTNGYIQSFQSSYNSGSNHGYNDLKAIYRWAGATDGAVASMSTSNTRLGTLYRNGDIKVDGKVVGHDAWVVARFGAGQAGFEQITTHAWARKTTTSLAHDTYPVIVHFGAEGNADFAVMVDCGNAVKFTPPPQPQPKLVCVSLDATPVSNSRSARFTAQASAQDTTITKYLFDFGDGSHQTVLTGASTTSITHAYGDYDTNHTVRVTVYGSDFPNGVTNNNCMTQFKTSPRGNLVCASLRSADTAQPLVKTFTATASVMNAKVTSYTFTYTGDGTTQTQTVSSSETSITQTHTFAQNNMTYTVSVAVRGTTTDGQAVTSPLCTTTITTPKPHECKPGVPIGDTQCSECKPGIPVGDTRCAAPQVLPNTGPGAAVGFAGLTGFTSAVGRYLYLRRRLGL